MEFHKGQCYDLYCLMDHGLQYLIYADDTQLYIAFSPLDKDDTAKAKLNMEKCITIIKDFLLENRMKLNDCKTEFIIMGTANKLKKVNFDDIIKFVRYK